MSITPPQTELDRRTRLDLKRRLKLAGFGSDLTEISDITTLRQLLNQRVRYEVGQAVEVQFSDGGKWYRGEFLRPKRYSHDDFDWLCVVLTSEENERSFCPECVRPISRLNDVEQSKLQVCKVR